MKSIHLFFEDLFPFLSSPVNWKRDLSQIQIGHLHKIAPAQGVAVGFGANPTPPQDPAYRFDARPK